MCPSAPRVCSEPGGQRPVLSLSLDLINENTSGSTVGACQQGHSSVLEAIIRLPVWLWQGTSNFVMAHMAKMSTNRHWSTPRRWLKSGNVRHRGNFRQTNPCQFLQNIYATQLWLNWYVAINQFIPGFTYFRYQFPMSFWTRKFWEYIGEKLYAINKFLPN